MLNHRNIVTLLTCVETDRWHPTTHTAHGHAVLALAHPHVCMDRMTILLEKLTCDLQAAYWASKKVHTHMCKCTRLCICLYKG